MSRFEQILSSPAPEVSTTAPRAAAPAKGRAQDITLGKEIQDQYWNAVLTNAYFLRYPAGGGRFEPMRPLYEVLEKLKLAGAGLARVEEQVGRGRIVRLKLEQGSVPEAEWNRIRAEELPRFKDQLRWLFTLSVMGAAAEYVDLGVELPAEWVGDVLGKHGSRIAELREDIIAEMVEKRRRSGLCFRLKDGRIYCLVPCKTGRRVAGGRVITELTPEEAVIVAEAQETGLLPAGTDGARSALKWGSGAA
ncbi:hypothetical protein [Pelotomaculum propionicicum]|uniref:hypothetical protein n=1 Tax=Pelotomaculum propionicicum TaxID=258475 RepID=UPI001064ED9D|nr:hypothetical protein [Pelotomaculum propionicicum]